MYYFSFDSTRRLVTIATVSGEVMNNKLTMLMDSSHLIIIFNLKQKVRQIQLYNKWWWNSVNKDSSITSIQ